MGENGVLVFPDAATRGAASSIDPNLLLALQNNGGFGGGNGLYWLFFLWMMWNQNGRNGNFNDYVASDNGAMIREICSLELFEKGEFHIYEAESGREVKSSEIPWKKQN